MRRWREQAGYDTRIWPAQMPTPDSIEGGDYGVDGARLAPSILERHHAAKGVEGYRQVQLLRRRLTSGEFEFTTIMWFDSLDAVRAFAGEEYERAYVPPKAREVLVRFDERSQHYELRNEVSY